MKSKINKVSINLFLNDMSEDLSSVKFEEESSGIGGDHIIIRFKIKGFSMGREVWPNESYEIAVKRLFEDFIHNSMNHHIRRFWKI